MADIVYFFTLYFCLSLYSYHRLRNIAIVTRVYSTAHSASSVLLALVYLWTQLPVYSILVSNSLAYCLYDITVITLGSKAMHIEPLMIVHHLAFMFGLGYFAQYPYYVAIGLLMETSSIFLNWSWYLHKTGQTHTITFSAVVGALVISYCCRILLLLYIIYKSIYELQCVVCVLFSCSLLAMNIHWLKKLFFRTI